MCGDRGARSRRVNRRAIVVNTEANRETPPNVHDLASFHTFLPSMLPPHTRSALFSDAELPMISRRRHQLTSCSFSFSLLFSTNSFMTYHMTLPTGSRSKDGRQHGALLDRCCDVVTRLPTAGSSLLRKSADRRES